MHNLINLIYIIILNAKLDKTQAYVKIWKKWKDKNMHFCVCLSKCGITWEIQVGYLSEYNLRTLKNLKRKSYDLNFIVFS